LLVTTAILVIAMVAYLHLGTPSGFAANQVDAMRYVADLLGDGLWRPLIIVTVLISTASTLWTTILYLSRSAYAMGRDGVLPRALGRLDARSEPLWSLAVVGVLTTICELITGFSPTAADALTTVLNVSSVFLGLLFVFSGAAAVRLFWKERAKRWGGVVIPAAGSIALLAVIGATIAFEERSLQYCAIAGVCLGVPFAAWRGRKTAGKAAGQPPGYCEPTALAP
jgi:APA family basic amino acid/polyamine antiporter